MLLHIGLAALLYLQSFLGDQTPNPSKWHLHFRNRKLNLRVVVICVTLVTMEAQNKSRSFRGSGEVPKLPQEFVRNHLYLTGPPALEERAPARVFQPAFPGRAEQPLGRTF